MKDMLNSAINGTARRGKAQMIKHLKGGKLTRGAAILAKCYDCQGMGDQSECEIESCSLYPFSQFKTVVKNQ